MAVPAEAAPFMCRSRSALLEGRSNLENRLKQQETRQVDTPEVKHRAHLIRWCMSAASTSATKSTYSNSRKHAFRKPTCAKGCANQPSKFDVTTIESVHPGVSIAFVCTTTESIQHEKPDIRQQPGLQHVDAALL